MKLRVHLADSPEPLIEGSSIETLCRVTIPNAAFVMMGDGEIEESIYDFIGHIRGLCSHCADLEMRERYVYAIRSGQQEPLDISPTERNIV